METSWYVLSHSFFSFFSNFSEEKWRRKFAGSMNDIQTLFITFIKWIFPKADKLILLILMRRITFSRTLLVTSTEWRGRQQESLIQRQFWESDTKLFLRIRYEIKHLQSRSPWFSFISYDELCDWMETNSQTWNDIRDQEKEIGFEENKYLLQLLGAHCNFSSSEKLSRLGRKVCNAGVDQLGAEQQQHQNETRPPPSQTMVPP